MRKILIIAGNGFIGSHIQDLFCTSTDKMIVLDERTRRFGIEHENIIYLKGSWKNKVLLKSIIIENNIEYIIHLDSSSVPATSNSLIKYDIENSLIPFINLLDLAVEGKIKKIIYASSGGAIYGDSVDGKFSEINCPILSSSYGIIKKTIESYLDLYNKLYQLNYVSLRIGNPYGPQQDPSSTQGVIAKFVYNVMNNKKLEIWGDGSIIKDYIYIDDVAMAFYSAMHCESSNGIINIGSGIGTSINELISLIESITEKKAIREYIPVKNHDVKKNILCVDKAKLILNWSAQVSLYDGLKETIEWQNEKL